MSIYHFIIGFSIAIPLMVLILSIPTFISIYKIGGFRNYLTNIKTLMVISRFIDKSYYYENNKVIQFNYPDGTKTMINTKEIDYFLPIYISSTEFYLVNKKKVRFI